MDWIKTIQGSRCLLLLSLGHTWVREIRRVRLGNGVMLQMLHDDVVMLPERPGSNSLSGQPVNDLLTIKIYIYGKGQKKKKMYNNNNNNK